MMYGVFGYTVACLASLALATQAPVPAARVIGGSEVVPQGLNFIVYISASNPESKRTRCTGSLITPNVVLTAAHCLYQNKTTIYSASDFQVSFNHSSSESSYSVTDVMRNPKYNTITMSNDLGLLKLETEVPEDVAKPVKIFTGDVTINTPIFVPLTESNPKGICAQEGGTGYYARVNPFLDWVLENAGVGIEDITVDEEGLHKSHGDSESEDGLSEELVEENKDKDNKGEDGADKEVKDTNDKDINDKDTNDKDAAETDTDEEGSARSLSASGSKAILTTAVVLGAYLFV
ncbi:hypothetical protein GGF46_004289 [Coemansia sp. RSA 552]|nr:hypothetical protein GGF46_004289 [Coemansia sp. RSA 552]